MHVIQVPAKAPPPKSHIKRRISLVVLLILLIAGIANYARPLPAVTFTIDTPKLPAATQPSLSWPTQGQAAVAAVGYGVVGNSGVQAPIATASIAKVITALCVLQKYPLSRGQSGPTITLDQIDVGFYETYQEQNGSRIPVTLGEKLTEYQALEALMLPSANNIAESLARWAFGSQAAYETYASQYLAQNGLTDTHIGIDASGFDASTTSTARDLAKLGLLAQQSPVLMAIASERSTVLPVAGTVYTYDSVLGQAGITGLKTGNNDADPGAFLFTANLTVAGQDIPVSGAVMGAPDLAQALDNSVQLIHSLSSAFEQSTILQKEQTIGSAQTAWGAKTPVVATKSLQLVRWKGAVVTEKHNIQPVSGTVATTIGTMEVSAGSAHASTRLAIQQVITPPSFWWRLTRH